MKKILFLFIIFIMFGSIQSVVGQDYDNTKLKIIDYLIKIGDLNPIDNKEKYFSNIFIVDLLNFEEDGNKGRGIFKFGTFTDHTKSYILLKDTDTFQILDLNKLDEDLLTELTFLRKLKISSSESLKYIEKTIIEYQKNLKAIPWTE